MRISTLKPVKPVFHTPPAGPGEYDGVFFILPRSSRGSMKNTWSFSPGPAGREWKTGLTSLSVDILISTLLIINKEDKTRLKRMGIPTLGYVWKWSMGLTKVPVKRIVRLVFCIVLRVKSAQVKLVLFLRGRQSLGSK